MGDPFVSYVTAQPGPLGRVYEQVRLLVAPDERLPTRFSDLPCALGSWGGGWRGARPTSRQMLGTKQRAYPCHLHPHACEAGLSHCRHTDTRDRLRPWPRGGVGWPPWAGAAKPQRSAGPAGGRPALALLRSPLGSSTVSPCRDALHGHTQQRSHVWFDDKTRLEAFELEADPAGHTERKDSPSWAIQPFQQTGSSVLDKRGGRAGAAPQEGSLARPGAGRGHLTPAKPQSLRASHWLR